MPTPKPTVVPAPAAAPVIQVDEAFLEKEHPEIKDIPHVDKAQNDAKVFEEVE